MTAEIPESEIKAAYEFMAAHIMAVQPNENVGTWEEIKDQETVKMFEIVVKYKNEALENKEREHQEKIREIRREIMTVKNYDTAIFIERTAVIEILDKHLDDKGKR